MVKTALKLNGKIKKWIVQSSFYCEMEKISYDNKIKNGTECEKSRFPDVPAEPAPEPEGVLSRLITSIIN